MLKFNEYDELISRAEAIQVELTQLLLEPRNSVYVMEEEEQSHEGEIQVKDETDGEDDIGFEPIYFEEGADEIDPSLLNDYQMEVVVDNQADVKENFGESSPRKSLKAALNTSFKGRIVKQEENEFIVVELSGSRAYQVRVK